MNTLIMIVPGAEDNQQTANILEVLANFIPLFQTVLWIALIFYLIYFFHPEINQLRAAFSERLLLGASVKVGLVELGNLQKEVKVIKKDLDLTNDRIARLFITTMGPNMHNNLKKMTNGKFGPFHKSEGLVRELYYLRDLGYIDVPSISNIPEYGEDLSEYLHVSATGREFVSLREEIIGKA